MDEHARRVAADRRGRVRSALEPHLVADEQLGRVGARHALPCLRILLLCLVEEGLLEHLRERAPALAHARLDLVAGRARVLVAHVVVNGALEDVEWLDRRLRRDALGAPRAVVAEELRHAVGERLRRRVRRRGRHPVKAVDELWPAHAGRAQLDVDVAENWALDAAGWEERVVVRLGIAEDARVLLVGELEWEEGRLNGGAHGDGG